MYPLIPMAPMLLSSRCLSISRLAASGPTSAPGAQDGELAVRGILYSQDKPSAVIGNQIVHEGEKVSGATIQKINKDSVEFELDGKKWTQQIQK